jgi:DNA-binding NarL/FixJ family response regulator
MTSELIEKKRAIIIDDHKLFTSGLCSILESINLKVMATFENGRDALTYLKNQEVDIIFTDINMPEMDGIQFCKKIKKTNIDAKIIMLSMYEDPNIIKEAFKVGANAYLSKNTEKEEIQKAIKYCFSDKEYVNKSLLKTSTKNNKKDKFTEKYKLTIRERSILQLMLEEESNTEISYKLDISKRTVETHRKNLLLKLEIKNNIGLARLAFTYDLFNPSSY